MRMNAPTKICRMPNTPLNKITPSNRRCRKFSRLFVLLWSMEKSFIADKIARVHPRRKFRARLYVAPQLYGAPCVKAKVQMFALSIGLRAVCIPQDADLLSPCDLRTDSHTDIRKIHVSIDNRERFTLHDALLYEHAAIATHGFFESYGSRAHCAHNDICDLFLRKNFKVRAGVITAEPFRLYRRIFFRDENAERLFYHTRCGIVQRRRKITRGYITCGHFRLHTFLRKRPFRLIGSGWDRPIRL